LAEAWVRDSGPGFLVDGRGQVFGLRHRLSLSKQPLDEEQTDLGQAVLDHLGLPFYIPPLAFDGKDFATDGEGTLLVDESRVLAPERNPGVTPLDAEQILCAYTGASRIIWLSSGETGNHQNRRLDQIARFIRPGHVLVATVERSNVPEEALLQENLARLCAARDALNRKLDVATLRQAPSGYSYCGFYLANGAVLLPFFDEATDRDAARTLRRLFPDREILPIPARELAAGGGIHALTLDQPSG
jgi:agmatine deiminase